MEDEMDESGRRETNSARTKGRQSVLVELTRARHTAKREKGTKNERKEKSSKWNERTEENEIRDLRIDDL